MKIYFYSTLHVTRLLFIQLHAICRPITSEGETRNETILEAAASALEFPWTGGLPVESSNPNRCSSEPEAALQPKIEADDECEFVCEIPPPPKAVFGREIETGNESKTEVDAASRIFDSSIQFVPASTLDSSFTPVSGEELSKNLGLNFVAYMTVF